MAALVWVTIAIAIWHFTIFLPDRFWGGIVGAFLGAILGGVVVGTVFQVASGLGVGETDIVTALVAVPGAVAGLGGTYLLGIAREEVEEVEEVV